jgi:hypothetical protein
MSENDQIQTLLNLVVQLKDDMNNMKNIMQAYGTAIQENNFTLTKLSSDVSGLATNKSKKKTETKPESKTESKIIDTLNTTIGGAPLQPTTETSTETSTETTDTKTKGTRINRNTELVKLFKSKEFRNELALADSNDCGALLKNDNINDSSSEETLKTTAGKLWNIYKTKYPKKYSEVILKVFEKYR